jgi:hypothetical protein
MNAALSRAFLFARPALTTHRPAYIRLLLITINVPLIGLSFIYKANYN